METHLIIFIVVLALSAIAFIAAIGVLIYYKRKDFKTEGECGISALAKKFTTISFSVSLSVLITLATTLLSAMISAYFLFMGLFIFIAFCGISIIAGPAVSLLGIAFSVVSVKREEGSKAYIFVSALSMLISLAVAYMYIYMEKGLI